MSPFQIRKAEQRDVDQLLGLYWELAEGDPARTPADARAAHEVFTAIVSDQTRHLCVAAAGDQVVGAAELIIVPNLTHHGRPWGVIENVIVTEAIRGHGAGTALLQHLIDLARTNACYKVQLLSGKQRADAHRLYRKAGFAPVAEGFKLYFDGTLSRIGP